MSAAHKSSRHGALRLLGALLRPGEPAAMTPALADATTCEPASRALTALATDAYSISRRWSHYAASSSATQPCSAAMQQRRAYAATGGHSPPWVAPGASDAADDVHKPGTALKRSTKAKNALHEAKEAPPWQGASAERLSRELKAYQSDLKLAKTVELSEGESGGSGVGLPFLEDAIMGVVEAERAALAARAPPPGLTPPAAESWARLSARTLGKRMGMAHLAAVMESTREGGTGSPGDDAFSEIFQRQAEEVMRRAEAADAQPWTSPHRNDTKPHHTHRKRGGGRHAAAGSRHGSDEVQATLAATANRVIGVLTAMEHLLPLAPWQRRAVSAAVVDSLAAEDEGRGSHRQGHHITAHSARTAVSFLLSDCGLSHRQAADVAAGHPWLLALPNARARCAPALEALRLLDMPPAALAGVVAVHPPALLLDADRDLLPLLDYLSGLGFSDKETGALLASDPGLLLAPGARDRLAGNVAFWVGRGVGQTAVKGLLAAAPEAAGMPLRLLQVKVDWLAEHAGMAAGDVAAAPDLVRLPLGAFLGPRVAFARHRGCTIASPPSLEHAAAVADAVCVDQLLSPDEDVYLSAVGGASDAEYRAFEAAWRGADLPRWLQRRATGTTAASAYEGMDWLADEEMSVLREMHDRHVALRELAWETQQDREREWSAVWADWKRAQARRDQVELWVRRMKKRQEEEAAERAAAALAALGMPDRLPGMCAKSPYCDRPDKHPGTCNTKMAPEGGVDEEAEAAAAAGRAAAAAAALGRGETVNEIATRTETESGVGFGVLEGVEADQGVELEEEDAVGGDWAAGRPLNREDIEGQDPEAVAACARELAGLLAGAPSAVLTARAVDQWAARSGWSRPVLTAAKGVLSVTGAARVVVEPNWNYHKVAAKAWQLLRPPVSLSSSSGRALTPGAALVAADSSDSDSEGESDTGDIAEDSIELDSSPSPHDAAFWDRYRLDSMGRPHPRLTRSAGNVLVLANLIMRMLGEMPGGVVTRQDLRVWAESRWKGAGKHVRAAVAVLLEQGLVVQRRQKGGPSGPMEVVCVDLEGYLRHEEGGGDGAAAGAAGKASWQRNEERSLPQTLADIFGAEEQGGLDAEPQWGFLPPQDPRHVPSPIEALLEPRQSPSDVLASFPMATHPGGSEFEAIFGVGAREPDGDPAAAALASVVLGGHDAATVEAYYAGRGGPERAALRAAGREAGADWSRRERLPPPAVRATATGLLRMLRLEPRGVDAAVVHRWAQRNGVAPDALAAATALIFTSGAAALAVDPLAPRPKVWYCDPPPGAAAALAAGAVRTPPARRAAALVPPLLEALAAAPGGFMLKKDARAWARSMNGGLSTGGRLEVALALETLVESGAVAETSLALGSSRRAVRYVALDLSAYTDTVAREGDGVGGDGTIDGEAAP